MEERPCRLREGEAARLRQKQNRLAGCGAGQQHWTIAIRQDVAEANHLKTLSDLGKWINGGGKFKLAASAEFIERPDALPAFQNAYGFKLNQDQLLSRPAVTRR